ncbi:MAG: ferrous iron transport protein A [Bifidobacterium sp.]|jgi:ferrous iron transport protein A|nr:ferrous iron transport protein A [Bifidobacterium sp.]MCI1865331.1 ferrous iron transport protein A [Bifidobacterium sp.]
MDDSLHTCPLGVDIEICRIDLDARYRFRLNELGFRKHERIRVIHKANFGGCVVAHGTERIAIDGATARHIFVQIPK